MRKGKLKFKGNSILLYRFGSDNAVSQYTHTKLPSQFRRGVWAFPYPFMDEFFTIHRIKNTLKKKAKYRLGGIGSKEKDDLNPVYDAEVFKKDWEIKRKKYKRTLSTFWYDGPILSRVGEGGNPNCYSCDGRWWHWTSPKVWADFAYSQLPNRMNCLSVDHLELFCVMKGS